VHPGSTLARSRPGSATDRLMVFRGIIAPSYFSSLASGEEEVFSPESMFSGSSP